MWYPIRPASFFILVYCLSVGTARQGYAQTNSYFFESLTIGQGLSHNTVYTLIQDRQGFMWLGTQNGLNKYDGHGYKVYRANNSSDPNFEGSVIYALLEDQRGNIWVGTQKNGINLLSAETGRFQNLKHDPVFSMLKDKWVYALFEDRQGQIWIGTQGSGLVRYNPKNRKSHRIYTQNSVLKSNYVFDFAQDEQGRVWIATGDANLYTYDPTTQKVSLHTAALGLGATRKTLLADQQGTLWIGTEGLGLCRFNMTFQTSTVYTTANTQLSSNNIRDLELDAERNLLIATDGGGLNLFNPHQQAFTVYRYNPLGYGALNTDALFDIWVAKNDNIWIGTYNGGANVYKPHKLRFETYTHTGKIKGELSHRSILSLLETREGQKWVGTDGGGLNLFDPKTKSFSVLQHQPHTAQSLSGNIIKALYEDVKGQVWIGVYDKGLDAYDPRAQQFRHYRADPQTPNALSSNAIWSITGTPKGELWIGTLGHGLNHFDPETGRFKRYFYQQQDPTSLADNVIMAVLYDRHNRLWVGTGNRGLDLFDPITQTFQHYPHHPQDPTSLSGNEVRAIFEDRSGQIWIGTEDGGLNKWLGNGTFARYSTQEGLLSNSIMGIAEDAQGNLWVSSFMGLSKLSPKQAKIQNFDFNHGEQANQFNQLALLVTREGDLMAGGINSLNILNRHFVSTRTDTAEPKVLITDLKVFNHSVLGSLQGDVRTIFTGRIEEAQTIELSYLDNMFSLEFASLDFDEPSNNRYRYKLEGFDGDWHTTLPGQRTATFTNIESGTYLFRVKGTNSTGAWSSQETSLKIVIVPPFWKTIWFRVLLFLAIILTGIFVLYLVIKRRERHLHEKMLEAESEILRLQNENLATELSAKNNQLVSIGLQMAHKNDFLSKIKQELTEIAPEQGEQQVLVRRMVRMVETEVKDEDFWHQFNVFFNEVNQNFMEGIQKPHPELSQNDLRLCALMIINLNTKEIASILNITPKSVEKSRNRLKKKLKLSAEDDLKTYLHGFK